jgi:putative phosphoesterase
MKIGILSDIHVDLEHRRPDEVIDALVTVIEEEEVAAVIIAGDVANNYVTTLKTLDKIEHASGARCIFVPGNHDIWNEHHPQKTSWQTYDALRAFSGNLACGPIELAFGWVAVGDLGWYDYSFGDPKYSRKDFDRMQIGDRLWQDKVKAVWGRTTLQMHRYFLEKLEGQLACCRGKKIILVTHVLPIADFTVPRPDPLWGYLNAFLGSRSYGELALEYAVRYSICGHVHYRKEAACNETRFICNCLNYASQWINRNDPLREIRQAFKTITLA